MFQRHGIYVNCSDVASTVKVLTISFYIQSYKYRYIFHIVRVLRFKSFLHAQGFGVCSSSKRYVYIHKHFVWKIQKCLLKKLYLRSENDPAKEMHAVTHKKENMKIRKSKNSMKC